MKKYWTKIAIALGPAILIGTVVWEYARVNPSYNFLVKPWSIRGYETDHGIIFVVLGILLLIGGIATAWEGALKPTVAASITAYFVIAATVFAAIFVDRTVAYSFSTVSAFLFSVLLGAAVAVSLRSLFRDRHSLFKRAFPVFIVAFAVLFGILQLLVAGNELSMQVWVLVFILGLVFAGLALSIRPVTMAANRMLILASVVSWGVVTFSAGALREHLIGVQLEIVQDGGVTGFAAQYKDTQAATGWWLAGFAMTILFVGSVGLWAKRRDIVAAIARARRQRAAAEKSAAEIAAAAELYAQEQSTANSGQ